MVAAIPHVSIWLLKPGLLQIAGVAHHWLWYCCVHVLPAGRGGAYLCINA